MSVGLGLLRKILDDKINMTSLGVKGVTADHFINEEKKAFEFIYSHVVKYGKHPKRKTVEREVGVILSDVADEPIEYWVDKVKRRKGITDIASAAKEILDSTRDGEYEEAFAHLQGVYSRLIADDPTRKITTLQKEAQQVLESHDIHQRSGGVSGVPFGLPFLDAISDGAQPTDTVAVVGRPGAGKAQPLDANIVMADGAKKQMREIRLGDEVASPDGSRSIVLQIHPQGKRSVFRVCFSDGRSAECDGSHLWQLMFRQWRSPRVVSTEQLASMLQRKRFRKRLHVPLCSGNFGGRERLPLDPWLVGFLLGDGSLTQCVGFSSADYEIVRRVNSIVLPLGYCAVSRGAYSYEIVATGGTSKVNRIKSVLADLGLMGVKSPDKRIPDCYLAGTFDERFALLQGLLDSDGTVDKNRSVSFSSSSKILAEQVCSLARSIGAVSKISPKKTKKLPSFRVGVVFDTPKDLFSLERKRDRCLVVRERVGVRRPVRLTVESVEYVGEKECQCITVTQQSGLYLTEDYVVTHNSYFLASMANSAWVEGERPLYAAFEMSNLQNARRLVALQTNLSATALRLGRLGFHGRKKLVSYLKDLKKNRLKKLHDEEESREPFFLLQGSLHSTVEDLVIAVQELKPSVLYVDGAYLLHTSNRNLARWERVSNTAEYLKSVGVEFGIPIISTYQFNRRGAGQLGNIAHADVIGQLASIVISIDDEDDSDEMERSISSKRYKTLELLKGREGESGAIRVLYDMHSMKISQEAILRGQVPRGTD